MAANPCWLPVPDWLQPKAMTETTPARQLAATLLDQVEKQQASLGTLLPKAMPACPQRDQGLLQELCFGVCRWQFYLDTLITPLLHKPLRKRDAMGRILLRLGAYQLLFMRIPAHAAINETVSLASAFQLDAMKGLLNAVLRKIASTAHAIDAAAAKASHPEWLQAKIAHNWPDQAGEIFWQNNQRPPMTLRVNRQKTTREAYLQQLKEHDIAAHACRYAEFGLTLDQPVDVNDLPGFADGWVSVQDEAAQLCSALLAPQAGEHVLDACAAPGGKTSALLEHTPSIQLEALELDAQRARRIHENLQRLGQNARVHIADATALDDWWSGDHFDAILFDAPCSATGVIRRHPDIKLLRRENDIVPLANVQLDILQTLWQTLKPGGRLIYATCSIFPQENSRIIQRFLKQEAGARSECIAAPWGQDTGFGRQLLPQANGHDGFFYACLIKPTHALSST